MSLCFPSAEFDDAVAAVCHGSATDAQTGALNELLRKDSAARDEYLLRVEVHSWLASEPELFARAADAAAEEPLASAGSGDREDFSQPIRENLKRPWWLGRTMSLAAALAVVAAGVWALWFRAPAGRTGATSTAVAMLTRSVEARWGPTAKPLRVGNPLEPGWLRLESGLAQVVFYSGARVVLKGPTDLQLISPTEAVCPVGTLLAEVPEPARGFRLKTAQINVVDLGTIFGIDASKAQTEVHVFKGKVEFSAGAAARQPLGEGRAARVQASAPPRFMAAHVEAFSPLFELQQRALASEAIRYDQWRVASARLNKDLSLVVHLDMENLSDSDWALRNAAERNRSVPEATLVGCQHAEGRWPEKRALEFQSVNDRVCLSVPGEFESITLAAWVQIKGLDRQFNSLFMCDGFEPGGIHWLVRNDGVLSLTTKGAGPREFQIIATPSVLTLDKFGMWIHLAVVVDGKTKLVVHYVNGDPVAHQTLKLGLPLRIGSAELGNWNARVGPNPEPSLIRNLSGSLDEFELFNRALSDAQIHELYTQGKPQSEP